MVDTTAEREATDTIEEQSSSSVLRFLLSRSARTETLEEGLMELTVEPTYEDGAVGGVKLVGVLESLVAMD
jgi:hypothetical protein